jgi:hypothetical protein
MDSCSNLIVSSVSPPSKNELVVIHVKAQHIIPLDITSADIRSHDFH